MFSLSRLRLSCYVDDPVGNARGTKAERERIITKVAISWLALGFHLAFGKAVIAEQGEPATWTTLRATLSADTVVAEVREPE